MGHGFAGGFLFFGAPFQAPRDAVAFLTALAYLAQQLHMHPAGQKAELAADGGELAAHLAEDAQDHRIADVRHVGLLGRARVEPGQLAGGGIFAASQHMRQDGFHGPQAQTCRALKDAQLPFPGGL